MKLFLKYVGEHLRNYPQVILNRQDEIKIRKSTMDYLGLKNMNHLRDRFEGQSFLDKTIRNYGGLIACEKLLGLEATSLNEINLRNFQPRIDVHGNLTNVHVFSFGELPRLSIKETKSSTLFVIQKDKLTFMICGYAETSVIQNYLIEPLEVTSSPKKYKNFVGFSHLQSLNELNN